MSERLTTFLKTVNEFADSECQKLEKTATDFKEEHISEYKKQSDSKTDAYIQYETNRLLTTANKSISEYEASSRASLTALRSELADKVFCKVREKISEFTKSDGYFDFLKASLENAEKQLNGCGFVFLSPADMKYAQKLSAFTKAQFKEDSSIVLGGIKACDSGERVMADDTLDMRLETQKSVFSQKADLKLI